MDTIVLKPLYHREKENIAIDAPNKGDINLAIRKLPGVRWSQTNKLWYMLWGKASYDDFVAALKPLVEIDSRLLIQYLNKRSEVTKAEVPVRRVPQNKPAPRLSPRKLPFQTPAWQLSEENLKALNRFIEELKLRGYSLSTMQTYKSGFLRLLVLLKQKPVEALTPDDLRRYMVYAMEKERISEFSAHSRLNALKFYFEQVLGVRSFFGRYQGPKSHSSFPKCLVNGN